MPKTPPNPKTLRLQAQRARASAARKAKRDAEKEAIEKAERIAGIQKGEKDRLIGLAAVWAVAAAKQGKTSVRVHLETMPPYEEHSEVRREALMPIWEMVAEHFEKSGYTARVYWDTDIRYEGSMDLSPVPGDTHYSLLLSWSGA